MNHGPRQARAFVARFLETYAPRPDRRVVICPSASSLEAVALLLRERPDTAAGIQNVWTQPRGAFTGENAAPMAREAGARYALVGHSERRHVFGETNADTAAKCAVVVENDLIPILCVGETLDERADGRAEAVVVEQLRAGIGGVPASRAAEWIVAYEPVWAIGTGKTASVADASAMHGVIRSTLAGITGGSADVPILYGGSVNADNARVLLDGQGIDGLLVGGASLDPITWAGICMA